MSINDNGIIDTLKESPERGFRMLMMKYQEPLYWHIRRLVVSHDDAQDAAQETFVRIYRSFDQYRGDCSFRSWIYRIATNEALRIISKRRQEVVSLESAATGVQFIAGDNYIDYDDKVAVKLQKAILTLPPKQQLAFNLRYYDELAFDEIARIADSTPSSIKANYHVAKEKIVKYMNSND
ncbi:RNA polymerase sigma factor [Prevotellaceae bacterium LCP21S3_C11]